MIGSKDIMAQTDLGLTKIYTDINGFYFIAAHTDSGTRFYSDPIATLESAESLYDFYIDIINYFHGGNIQLYKIYDDDFDVIAYTKI